MIDPSEKLDVEDDHYDARSNVRKSSEPPKKKMFSAQKDISFNKRNLKLEVAEEEKHPELQPNSFQTSVNRLS